MSTVEPRRSPPRANSVRSNSVRSAPPPFALERTFGATGAVERVELCEIIRQKHEVEDVGVLGDALAMGRLRDDRDAAFDAPAQQHLGGSALVTARDALDRIAGE